MFINIKKYICSLLRQKGGGLSDRFCSDGSSLKSCKQDIELRGKEENLKFSAVIEQSIHDLQEIAPLLKEGTDEFLSKNLVALMNVEVRMRYIRALLEKGGKTNEQVG